MKGLCPFHDERSPSFNVRPQAGFYHCFGCDESGDVYSFLRAMDHVSFTEAVERLAGRIGYTLHYEDGGAAPETTGRTRLYAANAAAAEYFRAQLATAEADTAPPIPRRARASTPAPPRTSGSAMRRRAGRTCADALHRRGFSDEELSAAGLVSQGQRGVYDRFRGRAIWPIRDVTSQVIGFGARKLYDDDQGPKYLNTPETPIYRKAQVLYGLDLAKRDISRDHRVVVVEGYTDVMACHLAGITTAIATLRHGVRLRPHHGASPGDGRRLRGRRGRLHVRPGCRGPEGGAARLRATRSASTRRPTSPSAPEGLDPCDLRLQRGDGAVRALMDLKVPMFEFVIDQRICGLRPRRASRGGSGALRSAAPIVAEIRDPLAAARVRPRARATPRPRHRRTCGREVERAARSAATSGGGRPADAGSAGARRGRAAVRVTIASLPRTADVALERDALMGFLQFGHRLDPGSARTSARAAVPASGARGRAPGRRRGARHRAPGLGGGRRRRRARAVPLPRGRTAHRRLPRSHRRGGGGVGRRRSHGGSSDERSIARRPSCSARSSAWPPIRRRAGHPAAAARARCGASAPRIRRVEPRTRRLASRRWRPSAAQGRMSTWPADATPMSRSAASDLSIARATRGGPDARVIDGVSFVLPHAATLAVMGPTGSGKSSLAGGPRGRRRAGARASSAAAPIVEGDSGAPARPSRTGPHLRHGLPRRSRPVPGCRRG